LTYVIVFIVHFIVAYFFIYEEASYSKPLLQAIYITILFLVIDVIRNNKQKKIRDRN